MALNWDKLNKQSNPTNNVKTLDWSKINTTPTNSKAQLNAYNTLLNATNVSTYDEMQPKAPKFDVQINTSAGDTGSLNTPKYQEIKNKNDNNVVKGSINSFGANLVDATVDAGQFVKNAFKSEMKKEERDAIELLIKLENGFRGSKGQMSEQQAQNAINNLRKAHKLEGMTVQQLQDRLNGIVDWTYKENALEKATSDAVKKVNEENAELGKVGQFVTSAFGTVGRMGPTIASNIALPGSGTATMFASTAQSRTEDLMDQGVNYKDAVVNGLLSGAMETGTEMLSGGISQKLTGIPALAKIGKYTDDIANPIIKTGLNVGGDILGEGLEEVASTAIQPFIDRITYNPNAQLATGEEMWSSFTQSILPTLLMQGGSVALQKVNEYNDAQKTAIENSNMPQTAKEQMIQALEEQKEKISAQINQITTQNNTNIAQTSPNNEQISQNNVQNVSNLGNVVQNINDIEKNDNTIYNQARGEENEQIQRERMLGNNNEQTGLYEKSEQKQINRYTREQYAKFEQSIKPIATEKLTDNEQKLIREYKNKYNKDIVLFENSQDYGGGASLSNSNKIYIDVNTAKEFGYKRIATHEVLESDILHNNNVKQIMQPAINNIINDPNFQSQKIEFWDSQDGEIPSDYLIAKDIICDIFAELENNEQNDYKNVLSENTNNIINSVINEYKKIKNSTQGSFLMPSTEQLQAQDKKQGEEIYNELNMKKKEVNKTLKESIEDISNNTNANKVSYTNDFYRNMKNALGEQAGRELTEKFDNSKLNHVKTKQNLANELKTYIVDELGIKPDSEMSADVQRFGEKEITEAELKTKYPKTWQNIVKADKWFRSKYDELIDAINATREEIYPNVEERVNETKDALLKTYDLIKQAEKTGIAPYKIDQDIQDNIKRLDERIEAKKEKIEEIEKANRPNYQKTKKYTSLVEQLSLLEQNKNELERTIGKRYDEKVERLKQRAQRLSDTLNSEELWRGKRIPKRENYYRHFQEMSEGFKALHNIFTTPSEISSKLAGTSEYTKPKSKFLGLAQKRLTNETEYDAVKGFLNYLEPASYAINIDPFITELRDITETIKKNTTETKNANKLTEYLDDFAGSLAGKTNPFDRPVQKVVGRKTMKAIEWTANRIKSNAVLGNINSSISQILNLPQVVAKIKDPIKMAQGVGDLVFNKGKYQDSQFIQERYHSDIMSQFNTKLTQQPKKFATWMLGALDEGVTKAGWNAVYRQAIEKGIDNPIKYADDTMRSLVAGRGIGERTLAQESKLTNLLMPFTVETGNYWRVMKDFVNEKDFGGILITFIVGWLLNRGIEAIGASGKTFDPIDAIYDAITEEDIGILQRIGRVGGEILSSMPMGQQIASLYPEYGADFGIFELPGREELFGSNDPTRFGTGNVLGKVFSNPVTGVALPWGGTQLRRTLEGANALIKGGDYKTNSKGEEQLKFPIDTKNMETSEKLLTAIQALTLGKYATPNADKYFEDGTLSKVKTKGYKKALETGMSAEEFYNIMQAIEDIEIPKRKNKEGKDEAIPGARKKLIIDELNKTDLNDKQKKLMYDVFYKQEVK